MRVFVLFLMLPTWAMTQVTAVNFKNDVTDKGIQFVESSWNSILSKARLEKKFVFVDCYATWCIPCKRMEKEIFTKKEVGDFINEKFISVRVQMDSTKKDDEYIKSWYKDAHEIKRLYKIKGFPSFLFFSPDGKIVHRSLGLLLDSLFLKVATQALSPEKQYYPLLSKYENGTADPSRMAYLASISKSIGEDSLAGQIAKNYIHRFLNKQSDKQLLEKKYFEFIKSFSTQLSSSDKAFKLLYKHNDWVDILLGERGVAKSLVQNVITREEITSKIYINNQPVSDSPNWDKLHKIIRQKYNQKYSDRIVLDAQINWYNQHKDWRQFIKYRVKHIDNYGLDTAGLGWVYVNNFAWNYVFKYCENRDTLNKVAGWMEVILREHPDDFISIDTYANLLFKAGKKSEAISWEEKAIVLEEASAKKEKREEDPSYRKTLEKMKEGIPTWVINDN